MSQAPLDTVIKAPADVLPYDVFFYRWLEPGDRILDATAVPQGDGFTVVVDHVDNTDDTVKVWLTGGTDGESGLILVTVTTLEGLTVEVAAYRVKVEGF